MAQDSESSKPADKGKSKAIEEPQKDADGKPMNGKKQDEAEDGL